MPKLKVREQLAVWREIYPAPCQAACPVHTDARSYVTLIGAERFDDAYWAAREFNPLLGICGKACSAPCEEVCTRREFDRPIRIRQLKRFLTDLFAVSVPNAPAATAGSVAVVGAGPAGLTAAHDLALLGHAVTVFEAAGEAGGMATLGVPRFRLGLDTIREDIEVIRSLGVKLKTGIRVGEQISLAELRSTFDAVFLATGAVRPNELDIPGRDLRGVVQALSYLREANLGGRPATGRRVAVIGGGYTAMDAARTALRLGAESVTILYRRTRHETEVHDDELRATLDEGARIQYLVSPLSLVDDGRGRVAGIRCIRNRLAEPDASGRPRPVPVSGSEFVFEADMVVLAVGQSPDAADVEPGQPDRLRDINPVNLMTAVPGVFAGGDFIAGPSTIIEAIQDGRRAARSIHEFLTGTPRGARSGPFVQEWLALRRRTPEPGAGPGVSNGLSLDCEVERPLTMSEAVREGMRCLFCGLLPTIVFEDCTMCHACVQVCPENCIYLVKWDEASATAVPAAGFRDAESYQIDPALCARCGRCMGACPVQAITVQT